MRSTGNFAHAAPHIGLRHILVRTISKRRLMQDAEARQPLCDFGSGHRGAVVAQRGARQAALLERL
jgi:hypothetical protein